MNKLNNLKNNAAILSYYHDLDQSELERRMLIFLEIYPFLLYHFKSLDDEESFDKNKFMSEYKKYLKDIKESLSEVEI